MKIFMISGKAGHGKTEFGEALKQELETNYHEKVLMINFADVLKFFLTKYYEWDGQKNIDGRNLLQHIGDIMREEEPEYWANIVSKFISAESKQEHFTTAIIADWRFINEFKSIQLHTSHSNNRIYTIRINRFNSNNNSYINPNMSEEQLRHISEIELDNFNFDYYINNINLNDLNTQVKILIDKINNL